MSHLLRSLANACKESLEKYKGHYKGYSTVRESLSEDASARPCDKSSTTLWPIEEQWGEHGEYWPWDERNMEVYAAMVDSMDQGIGKIVQALETNQFNNTLVCYMQDNGGCGGMGRRVENQERQHRHPSYEGDTLQVDMIQNKPVTGTLFDKEKVSWQVR